jgi:hypothetical protein
MSAGKTDNSTENHNKTNAVKVENSTASKNISEGTSVATKKQDLLAYEIAELQKQIDLSNRKLNLLQELRSYYISQNITPADISEETLIKLLSSKPALTDNYRRDPSQLGARTDPFHAQKVDMNLMSKIFKKLNLQFNEEIIDLQFMAFKQLQRSTDDTLNFLIAALGKSSTVYLYDLNGALILELNPGHDVHKLAMSPWTDEYFISTLGHDGTIKVFLVDAERVLVNTTTTGDNTTTPEPKRGPPKFTFKYYSKLEFVYDLCTKSIVNETNLVQHADNECVSPTFFITYNLKGNKFFIVGDKQGDLTVIMRNGTSKGKVTVDGTPILALQKYYNNLLVATSKTVAFMNPNLMQLASPQCDSPGDEIIDVVADFHTNTNFYVLTNTGIILIYEIKAAVPGCKVIARKTPPTKPEQTAHIYSTKGFLMYKSEESATYLLAFNVTDPQNPSELEPEYFNISLVELTDLASSKVSYATIRNSFSTSLIAAYALPETHNTTSLILYELNIPFKPATDWLANLRFPIILGAILLALVYQWWQKKKTTGIAKNAGFYNKDYDKYKMDSLDQDPGKYDKPKLKPSLKKPAQDVNKLRADLDHLSRNTKHLEDSLGNLDALKDLKNLKASAARFRPQHDNDDDDDDGLHDIITKKNK